MNPRQMLAMALGPLMLRVVLGITFVWAGAGKLLPRVEYTAGEVATLRTMGLSIGEPAATGPSVGGVRGASGVSEPVRGGGDVQPRMQPPAVPLPVPSDAAPEGGRGSGGGRGKRGSGGSGGGGGVEPAGGGEIEAPVAARVKQTGAGGARAAGAGAKVPPTQAGEEEAAAGRGATLRNVYKLALLLNSRSEVRPLLPNDDIRTPVKLWPSTLGAGVGAFYAAWATAIVELAGGFMLLAGLFTRVWALVLAVVIVTAMWLTQLGPGIWSGNTYMGFIPAMAPWWEARAYATLLWQAALAAMLLTLLVMGAGPLSLDRAVFSEPGKATKGQARS